MFGNLKQLAKESLVYGLSGVAISFISFFLIPIYTRIFSPSEYGTIDLIAIFFTALSIFVVLGTDTAQSLYFYNTDDSDDKKVTLSTSIFFQVIVSIIFALSLFLLSEKIAQLTFNGDSSNGIYFRLMALDLPFFIIIRYNQRLLRLIREPWKYSIFMISSIFSNLILTILLVVIWRKGIYGIYLSKLIVDCIFSLIAVYLFYPYLGRCFSWVRLRQLLSYGLPLIPASIASWVLLSSNRYFLSHYSSLGDVGLYSLGNKVAAILSIIVGAFQLAWAPFAFSIHRQENAKKVYANVLTYFLVLTSSIGIGLSLLSSDLLSLFATSDYYGASIVVSYIAFGDIAKGAYFIVAIGVNITKKTSHIGWTTMLSAGVNIGLNFLLIPRFGMVGAAISFLFSQCVSVFLLYIVSQHYYFIPFRLKDISIISISSLILIMLGSQIQLDIKWLNILIKLFIVLFYLTILILTKVLPINEILRSFKDRKKDKVDNLKII